MRLILVYFGNLGNKEHFPNFFFQFWLLELHPEGVTRQNKKPKIAKLPNIMKILDFWPIFGLKCAKFVEVSQKMPKTTFLSYQRLSLIGFIPVSVNFGEYSVFQNSNLPQKWRSWSTSHPHELRWFSCPIRKVILIYKNVTSRSFFSNINDQICIFHSVY